MKSIAPDDGRTRPARPGTLAPAPDGRGPGDEPDFTDRDIRLMDAIWDRIGREKPATTRDRP